jgi:hypothetical protein
MQKHNLFTLLEFSREKKTPPVGENNLGPFSEKKEKTNTTRRLISFDHSLLSDS